MHNLNDGHSKPGIHQSSVVPKYYRNSLKNPILGDRAAENYQVIKPEGSNDALRREGLFEESGTDTLDGNLDIQSVSDFDISLNPEREFHDDLNPEQGMMNWNMGGPPWAAQTGTSDLSVSEIMNNVKKTPKNVQIIITKSANFNLQGWSQPGGPTLDTPTELDTPTGLDTTAGAAAAASGDAITAAGGRSDTRQILAGFAGKLLAMVTSTNATKITAFVSAAFTFMSQQAHNYDWMVAARTVGFLGTLVVCFAYTMGSTPRKRRSFVKGFSFSFILVGWRCKNTGLENDMSPWINPFALIFCICTLLAQLGVESGTVDWLKWAAAGLFKPDPSDNFNLDSDGAGPLLPGPSS
jgi:hypothetical protein